MPRSLAWRMVLRAPARLAALVVWLACGGPALTQVLVHSLPNSERLAVQIARPSDLDGDGFPDYALGVPQDDELGWATGSVRIHSGKTGDLLHRVHGLAAGDGFGWSLDSTGDVNGDGCGDLVVGAPWADLAGTDSGAAWVLSGADASVLHVLPGPQLKSRSGWDVAGAGDVDGDGCDDVIVGAITHSWGTFFNGAAGVYSGRDGSLLHLFKGPKVKSCWFGYSVAGAGDVDADGFDDLLVGAPYDSAGGVDSGSAFVFSGRTGEQLLSIVGPWPKAVLGYQVAGAGNVDADCVPDVAVLATDDLSGYWTRRFVRVYSGRDGHVIRELRGNTGQRVFGYSLSTAGDVDADGSDDLWIAGWVGGLPTWEAAALLFSGRTGAELLQVPLAYRPSLLDPQVQGGFDANLDDVPDVLVSAGGGGYLVDTYAPEVFALGHSPQIGYCSAKPSSSGCVPTIQASGGHSLTIGADSLRIEARDVAAGQLGVLLWGLGRADRPWGGGALCVAAPFVAVGVQISGAGGGGSACTGSYSYPFSQAYMAALGLAPGDRIHAQWWSRDPGLAPPSSASATAAMAIELCL